MMISFFPEWIWMNGLTHTQTIQLPFDGKNTYTFFLFFSLIWFDEVANISVCMLCYLSIHPILPPVHTSILYPHPNNEWLNIDYDADDGMDR